MDTVKGPQESIDRIQEKRSDHADKSWFVTYFDESISRHRNGGMTQFNQDNVIKNSS